MDQSEPPLSCDSQPEAPRDRELHDQLSMIETAGSDYFGHPQPALNAKRQYGVIADPAIAEDRYWDAFLLVTPGVSLSGEVEYRKVGSGWVAGLVDPDDGVKYVLAGRGRTPGEAFLTLLSIRLTELGVPEVRSDVKLLDITLWWCVVIDDVDDESGHVTEDVVINGEVVPVGDRVISVVPVNREILSDEELWDTLPDRSKRLLREVPDFDEDGLAPATVEAYRRQVSRYVVSAWILGFDPSPITPAKAKLHFSRMWTVRNRDGKPTAPSTIVQAVAALKWWIAWERRGITDPEELAKLPDLGTDLKKFVKNYTKKWGKRWRVQKADAIPYSFYMAMVDSFDRSTVRGKRNAAMLLLNHATGCRSGELVSLDIDHWVKRPGGVRQVRFPHRKNDYGTKRHEPEIRPNKKNPRHCPVFAVDQWIKELHAVGRTSGPLFIAIGQDGEMPQFHQRLNRVTLSELVTRTAEKVSEDLGHVTGHSVRTSTINQLLLNGIGIEFVSPFVGHSSLSSTQGYQRELSLKGRPMMDVVYESEEGETS